MLILQHVFVQFAPGDHGHAKFSFSHNNACRSRIIQRHHGAGKGLSILQEGEEARAIANVTPTSNVSRQCLAPMVIVSRTTGCRSLIPHRLGGAHYGDSGFTVRAIEPKSYREANKAL